MVYYVHKTDRTSVLFPLTDLQVEHFALLANNLPSGHVETGRPEQHYYIPACSFLVECWSASQWKHFICGKLTCY